MAKASAKLLPLDIDTVYKSFGPKEVLDGFSLSIKEGEIFGLIGLNGVGKTTIIKIILGLLEQDAGSVKIFGSDIEKISTRKKIAYLPEKFQPSPFLKGKEFLSLSLSYYKMKLDMKKAEEYADMLHLDPAALDLKITKYSKGMTQKLGLLSGLLTEAPLLILDEPMSGLDPRARILLKENLLNYAKNGRTIFFSSHILSDIDEICNDIAVIHNRQILFSGTPNAFKKKYKQQSLERAFLKAIGE